MNTVKDLALIIKSRFPLVCVETNEETRLLALIENACNLENWAGFTWTIADGIRRINGTGGIPETYEFQQALRHIDKTPQNGVYVLLDAHPYLVDPVNIRLIKEIAQEYGKNARTLVFVSRTLELPHDLQRLAARFTLPLPDRDRIREMIRARAMKHEADARGKLRGSADALEALIDHLTGMCEDDAQRLIDHAIGDAVINHEDVARALQVKRETVGMSGLLDCEIDTGSFADVGGLKHLKRWLDVRRPAFAGAESATSLDRPKGVLLLGVQGGGKSLAAKAVAGTWTLPLLRLDFGVLYNKFHGETERNLREGLKQVEAMQPSVLWIDEIEKGLSTDDGTDGGVSRRLLGSLLTWMAERKSRVFIVATANDVSQLPPELLRKGRFDEIFFVDLPDAQTREEIFRIHLRKRKMDPESFDVQRLAALTDGYSGAEIEQAIVASLYEAAAKQQPLATADIEAETGRTRPLSVVMAERVHRLREWARERTVPAN